jgi:hypothetical protein
MYHPYQYTFHNGQKISEDVFLDVEPRFEPVEKACEISL